MLGKLYVTLMDTSDAMVPIHVGIFKDEWLYEFGTEISGEFKTAMYDFRDIRLKHKHIFVKRATVR
jgi:hypothetical protein